MTSSTGVYRFEAALNVKSPDVAEEPRSGVGGVEVLYATMLVSTFLIRGGPLIQNGFFARLIYKGCEAAG